MLIALILFPVHRMIRVVSMHSHLQCYKKKKKKIHKNDDIIVRKCLQPTYLLLMRQGRHLVRLLVIRRNHGRISVHKFKLKLKTHRITFLKKVCKHNRSYLRSTRCTSAKLGVRTTTPGLAAD